MDPRPPLRFPAQRKSRAPRKLKPPTKDSPRCENLLNRRQWVDINGDGTSGIYATRPPEQCTHRGRPYKLNGFLTMTLCICCISRLRKKSTVTLRQVRNK
jgi:hypothetical protein